MKPIKKICWPNPDVVCLQGGCVHCSYGEWVKVTTILAYAKKDEALYKAYLEGTRNPLRFDWKEGWPE